MTETKKYTCPCCGYKVFSDLPGSFEICPICCWEDEAKQLRYPKETGANQVSLIEAQMNFEKDRVSHISLKIFSRQPNKNDIKDPKWRKINLKKDKVAEKKDYGKDSVNIYPADLSRLYYWEENFLEE